ncbi:hypothetical protein TNCV_3148091 [Trichonephila clavipes]|nr:hypothetical protein TNCV_3148091 [Trichonephila clavipes]
MVLKVNDRRTSCPCHDEFRGPRSDYVRQASVSWDVPLHADGLPAGSGDTRFYPLPLCAAQSRHRHPCSATNALNSDQFRLTPFQCQNFITAC